MCIKVQPTADIMVKYLGFEAKKTFPGRPSFPHAD